MINLYERQSDNEDVGNVVDLMADVVVLRDGNDVNMQQYD